MYNEALQDGERLIELDDVYSGNDVKGHALFGLDRIDEGMEIFLSAVDKITD